jgi:putative resolvase
MKLSTFARRAGICYRTAWRWWKAGKIKGYQMETGTVVITEEISEQPGQERVVVYARVSANENRPNLDSQAERLRLL